MKRPLWLFSAAAVLCLSAVSTGWGDPARDEIALKISRALTRHLAGDEAGAADLLEAALRELRPPVEPPPYAGPEIPRGNASKLLEYLDVYALYALGQRADLDAAFDALRYDLLQVDAVEALWPRPRAWDGMDLEYDPFSQLARAIGDLKIDYDAFRPQIRRIGAFEIRYDPFEHQPTNIGGIEFEYDPFSHRLVEVAGVKLP